MISEAKPMVNISFNKNDPTLAPYVKDLEDIIDMTNNMVLSLNDSIREINKNLIVQGNDELRLVCGVNQAVNDINKVNLRPGFSREKILFNYQKQLEVILGIIRIKVEIFHQTSDKVSEQLKKILLQRPKPLCLYNKYEEHSTIDSHITENNKDDQIISDDNIEKLNNMMREYEKSKRTMKKKKNKNKSLYELPSEITDLTTYLLDKYPPKPKPETSTTNNDTHILDNFRILIDNKS